MTQGRALGFMPAVFVLIWSTGFVVARYGMPYAPPIKFLCVRYALSAMCFVAWAGLSRAKWPEGWRQWRHLAITGCLIQAGYLGGVWSAVKAGMGAGTVALLVSLQPVLTAVWLSLTAARVSRAQWIGLALGFAGLVMVVWHKLHAGEVTVWNLSLAMLALLSITIGTLYQKRFVEPCDVRTASAVQLLGSLLISLPLIALEHESIVIHPHMIGAMLWSVFVLTLGGGSLLYLLIQRGAATQVTSLFYMVPPTTAVMAWALFDEPLTVAMLAGTALTAAGVALVSRSSAR